MIEGNKTGIGSISRLFLPKSVFQLDELVQERQNNRGYALCEERLQKTFGRYYNELLTLHSREGPPEAPT